ncbi:MAG: hydrogen peroxide-inducible genes activator [Cohaesibacter sp.]|nr:hydrogen peroxide-inducible genes activator [Cohaesibacter sp.]
MTIRPTLRQLQYLCAVADKRSFRAAAEACYVSQSTLSSGIKQLEDGLQTALIDRESPVFALTPHGEVVLERAKVLLRDVDDLVAAVQVQSAPLSGRLRLGIIPSIGPFLLPKALPSLRVAFPDLRLYLRESLTRDVLENLRSGQLDAAVIALPYQIKDLSCKSLGRDFFQVAVPKGHRLATQTSCPVADLQEETLILLEDGHCLRDHILSSLKRSLHDGDDIHATSLTTIVQMVANGLGATLLPQIALDAGLVKGQELDVVPLAGNVGERELALVWRPHSALERDISLLADHLIPFVTA